MTVSVATAGPYYSTGEIKFSDLRRDFRAQQPRTSSGGSETTDPSQDSGAISAVELLRKTSTTDTNPIVPDSTENASIGSSTNWKLSQFRNSIKYYYISQSGTNTNLDIDAQSWNSNLGKNIVKLMFIDGTCGSNDAAAAAVGLDVTTYNLTIKVNGYILGAGGKGGGTTGAPSISGQKGGDALSIQSPSGNNIVVGVSTGARIWGGGGGGEKGYNGSQGSAATCVKSEQFKSGCQQGAISCPGGWSQTASWEQCCEEKRGCNANYWYRICELKYTTGTPPAGYGGVGGLGRGYNNQAGSLSGGAGGGAQCPSCAGGYSQQGGSCSTNGGYGANGGAWSKSGGNTSNSGNGGAAGRAITGSIYSVTGTLNTDTIKGTYT